MGKLGDKEIQALKPKEGMYKIGDGDGIFLVIQVTGKKLWQLRYRFGGKQKTFSIGQYPIVSLKEARERGFEARKLLAGGVDPMENKKERKALLNKPKNDGETVEAIGKEWFEKFSGQWVDSHASKIIRRLERDLFPHLGKVEIKTVTPPQLLAVLRRVEARGALETAHRLHQNCGQVWRYAVATGRVERDITGDLRGALPPAGETHLAAITDPKEICILLKNIDEYKGSEVVRLALRLAPLVFVRPGELRQAKWSEFDFDKAEWVVPKSRMKLKRRQHVVPLSRQVLVMLKELQIVSGDSEYLFPSPRAKTRCLSDVALLAALRRMGYTKEEMTAHGFRAMASTNLEQLGFDVRLIELQLAHEDQNEIRAAYKRDLSRLQLDQRVKMMQAWADYLDGLKV